MMYFLAFLQIGLLIILLLGLRSGQSVSSKLIVYLVILLLLELLQLVPDLMFMVGRTFHNP